MTFRDNLKSCLSGLSFLVNKQRIRQGFPNPSFWGHVVLVVGIAGFNIAVYFVTIAFIQNRSGTWHICPLGDVGKANASLPASATPRNPGTSGAPNPSSAPSTSKTGTEVLPPIHGNSQQPDFVQLFAQIDSLDNSILPGQKIRLINQLNQLRQAQTTSCEIGVFFYAHRNAALTVITASGIFAISSLAFISKEGWENSNNAIINLGVTSGLILFSSWTFSQLYGQGVNYESQRQKYVLATTVLNSVASAIANQFAVNVTTTTDGTTPPAKGDLKLSNAANMAVLIQYLDAQLERINAINFTGDASFAEQSVKSVNSFLKTSDRLLPKP